MTDDYQLFGVELSPYSVKARSYLRYKQVPHRWINRSADTMAEFQRYAKLPLIPLLVTPDGQAMQDSTPMMEMLEAAFPERPTLPPDQPARFVAQLLEEYADEWLNKAMFHYRWTYEADQNSSALLIAQSHMPQADDATLAQMSELFKQRQIGRLPFVGSNPVTLPLIEASFKRGVDCLEAHLQQRPFLFGGHPVFADFGLAAQYYQLLIDPTPRAYIETYAPQVQAWVTEMLRPEPQGELEPWSQLEPTLLPFLQEEVAALFLPWSEANRQALEKGEASFEVMLQGKPFSQDAQKYHAKSLAALRAKYAEAKSDALQQVMQQCGCHALLQQI